MSDTPRYVPFSCGKCKAEGQYKTTIPQEGLRLQHKCGRLVQFVPPKKKA